MKTIKNWYANLSDDTRFALDLLSVCAMFVVTGVSIMGATAAAMIYIHPVAGLFTFIGCFAVVAFFCDN